MFLNLNPCIICVTMNYSFGNYWLTEFHRSSKCWCLFLPYKNAFVNITVFLIRKIFKHCPIHIFQNSNFCLQTQILSLATNTVSFSSLKWQVHFIYFAENYKHYSAILSDILSSNTGVTWKKKTMSIAHNSKGMSYLSNTRLSQKILKKTCSQGLKCNKITNFYCRIKGILKWNWLLFGGSAVVFNCEYAAMRNTTATGPRCQQCCPPLRWDYRR